jgi:hypothetical protein
MHDLRHCTTDLARPTTTTHHHERRDMDDMTPGHPLRSEGSMRRKTPLSSISPSSIFHTNDSLVPPLTLGEFSHEGGVVLGDYKFASPRPAPMLTQP